MAPLEDDQAELENYPTFALVCLSRSAASAGCRPLPPVCCRLWLSSDVWGYRACRVHTACEMHQV